MSQPSPPPAAGAPARSRPPSTRVRMARLALETALAVPGVAGGHGGRMGLAFTNDAGERLQGVIATALPGGKVGLELHLVADLVPLYPLADAVRERVTGAAAAAGLAGALGPVDVAIDDVVDPTLPLAATRAGQAVS